MARQTPRPPGVNLPTQELNNDSLTMISDRDTIFALSSGRPPVAIAVIRVSGPRAQAALETLAARVPEPRRAGFARLRDRPGGDVLDEAVVLWFPGPHSETGEDVAEFQVHGGRAVIAAVLAALGRIEGLRPAGPGEFTRRGVRGVGGGVWREGGGRVAERRRWSEELWVGGECRGVGVGWWQVCDIRV